MGHGLGVTDLAGGVPDVVVLLFALLTQLGDVWFYVLWLTVAYALAETLVDGDDLARERVAVVIAVALGALALSAGLKELFAHPRPPGSDAFRDVAWLPRAIVPLFETMATADGYSLPSGHAAGSAAVYGGAALLLRAGRARVRYLLAVAVVATVAASRVILGVHYLGDVLQGILVGGGYLAVVYLATDRGARVTRAFSLAVLVAVVGAALRFSVPTLASLGGALGGRIGWAVVGERATTGPVTRREGAISAAIALPLAGACIGVAASVETPAAGFAGYGLAVVAVLGAPLAARRLLGFEPGDGD